MGRLPLYEEAADRYAGARTLPKGAHAGLWYDKFCNAWGMAWDKGLKADKRGSPGQESDPKAEWLATVTQAKVGDSSQIAELAARQKAMADALGGIVLPFRNDSRFVTGLGREHPMENGFAWHPVLGTPYVPGSGVKGMVRSWAASWAGAPREDVIRVFGPEGDEARKDPRAGTVIFLDAIPVSPMTLCAEIMNPHYGPYYQKGEVPGDWHDPVPIKFLAVERGQEFQFALLPRGRKDASDVELARQWLVDALGFIGAGAKTAAGFGRFEPIGAAQNNHMAKPQAPVDPFEEFKAWFEAQRFSAQNKGRHMEIKDQIEQKLGGSAEAKAFVKEKLGRKTCSDKFWSYLNS